MNNPNKIIVLITFCVLFFSLKTNAQEVRVIDNKGTIQTVNNTRVFTGIANKPSNADAVIGDTYFDQYPNPNSVEIWDGASWKVIKNNITHTGTSGSIFFADIFGNPTENNLELFWDTLNNNLHIGAFLTGRNSNKLNVRGTVRATGYKAGTDTDNGTANRPSYTFFNDVNTGMYRGTNVDELNFSTGGIHALSIDASQNISIPQNLSVTGTYSDSSGDVGTAGQILSSTGIGFGTNWIDNAALNNWSLTGNATTDPTTDFLGTTDAQDLVFKTRNIEALRINQLNQYIGIGIAGATSPLHIVKDLADGVGIIRVQGTEPDIIFNDTDGGYNTFTFENNGTPRFAFGRRGNGIDPEAFYFTRNDGTGWKDGTFYIRNSTGFVGLDTEDPTQRLDVNGKLRVRTLDAGDITTDKIVVADTNGVLKKIDQPYHTVGDIKNGVQTADHSGWYILNGRATATISVTAQAAATSLGFATNLPDATDRVLKHPNGGEAIGDIGGATTTTLSQGNLPNIPFPTVTATTTTNGRHRHRYSRQVIARDIEANGIDTELTFYGGNGDSNTARAGNHNHDVTVTVSSGGNDESFERYQPYLVVNTFIYLGL